jgi:hypothetical protein
MSIRQWASVGWVLALAASSCTALREIPRGEYAARPERRDVAVETRDSLSYEFEFVRVSGDSLVGYRRRDVEGRFDEYDAMGLPFDQIVRLSARRVDWYRTGLIGGTAIAAIVISALSRSNGGGSTTPPPNPCGDEPCR